MLVCISFYLNFFKILIIYYIIKYNIYYIQHFMAYCSIEEAWGLKTNSTYTAITSNNISSNVYNGNGIENDGLDDGVRFDNKYQMKNSNARNVSNRLSTNLRISPQTASSNGITVSSQQRMTQPNAITKPQMDLIPPVNTNLPMYNLSQTHKASLKHIKDNDRNNKNTNCSSNSNYQTIESMGDVSGFLTMDKLQPMSLETNGNNPPFLNDYYDYSSYAPSVASYGLNATNTNPNKNEWSIQKENNPLNLLGYDTHHENNPRFNLVGIPNQLPTSHSYSDNSDMLLNNTPIENYRDIESSKNTNNEKQNLKIITEMLDRIRELETEVNYLKLKQNENKTSGSNMHDIILFILVGIFVLFVLDGIFRIGRATI